MSVVRCKPVKGSAGVLAGELKQRLAASSGSGRRDATVNARSGSSASVSRMNLVAARLILPPSELSSRVQSEITFTYENRDSSLLHHCSDSFCSSWNNSSLAGVSRAKLLGCGNRRQTASSDQSDQLSFVENRSTLLALLTVHLGRSAFPHNLCGQRTPNPLLSAQRWQPCLVARLEG